MVSEDEIKAFVDRYYEQFMANHMRIEPPFKLVSEYTLPNGQAVDKVILGTNKKILALIECKGEVNLNEFVRGTGQAIQGAYQITKNQRDDFAENCKSFLLVPIEMAKNVQLDLFDLHNFELIFVDTKKNITIKYNEKDYASTKTNEWVTINPYYFRDCSLYGVYILLRLLLKNSAEINKKTITQLGEEIRKIKNDEKIEFFGDIKNNGITLSNLGFYDQSTRTLTIRGYEFAKKSFPDFCKEIILKDLGEYSRAVFLAILSLKNEKKLKTENIADLIKKIYQGKKVTYLFDPDGQNRDLLTIIRMLELIGAIKREKEGIKINYFPLEGMPFLMEEYNKEYLSKLRFWFDKFKIAL